MPAPVALFPALSWGKSVVADAAGVGIEKSTATMNTTTPTERQERLKLLLAQLESVNQNLKASTDRLHAERRQRMLDRLKSSEGKDRP